MREQANGDDPGHGNPTKRRTAAFLWLTNPDHYLVAAGALSRVRECRGMPDYRLYNFEGGHIVKAHIVTADDDAAAIESARELAGDQPAELCGKL